jgi:hypothetical protein
VTEAEPSLPPLHNTLVEDEMAADTVPVVVMLAVVVTEHPLASVMVQVYDPAASPDAVAEVPPDGAHAYVYGPTPPEAVAVADPLLPPQVALTVVLDAVSAAGSVMVTVADAEQLNASSTVTEYVPAINP